ncbi:tRNA (adenosine(37)-N6)-threonylcarbamoyltransferase complex transferase subunit TsaD [Parvibacter caecicola]|uniref:tRNA (adenosine(37)-N6)-threonylcarbamoyltransferase complex transferase subunit TsaD n=1 Tax=Parvibacter caecicola TaxID=747645 RepID=UPI00249BD839|nr:tRNA (adenosine(37)-N6)-threonylcarbamoyltransferase complex transferase subunit TsaD [Parvibacter caecicola]
MTQRNYVLAFDTANEVIAVGLGRLNAQDKTVEEVAALQVQAHRASNTRLLPEIEQLLRKAGVERSSIACVAVGRGPGSFTGVRIAVATAKGIASALGAALVGLSSLDAVAWNAWVAGERGRLLVAADAMRREVYPVFYQLEEDAPVRLEEDAVLKAQAFADQLAEAGQGPQQLAITGDGLAKYQELFAPAGRLLAADLWAPTGAALLRALQAQWQAGECDPFDAARHNPAFVLPVYTRLSDAEEAERRRNAMASEEAPARDSRHVTMHDTAVLNARAGSDGVAYKPLRAARAADVAALEAACMGSDAWSEASVADDLGRTDRVWWAAYQADPSMPLPAGARLLGYAGALVVDSDAQILKVAVVPEFRRRGIARELVARVADDARNLNARTSSLEVRASNASAQAFYETLGYQPLGRRPRYYSDGEDAIIMQAPQLPSSAKDVAGMDLLHQTAPAGGGAGESAAALRAEGTSVAAPGASSPNGAADGSSAPAAAAEGPLILAIESSCDETAAAVTDGTGRLLADVIASQVDFHARFGGVVPEIASRKHIEAICGVCDAALEEAAAALGQPAPLPWNRLDAMAVTYAPGLVGALVVGVAFAKGAAWALDIPFIVANHLEGHLYANKIGAPDFAPSAVVSLVSGGNTLLVHMADWGRYQVLGSTIDDAVGEAFDKVAKALGLGYPGGPAISRFAAQGNPAAIDFPRAMMRSGNLDFSLSGLKTAVVNYVNQQRQAGQAVPVADVCASFQQAVVDVQIAKARTALQQTGAPTFCLGGGVAANPVLREAYQQLCAEMGVQLVLPPLSSCGDNAGMIALVALDRYRAGKFAPLDADAAAGANLEEPY